MSIIGRENEKFLFKELTENKKSNFVVVFGRRRIGKTYLIRNYFNDFNFYHTGVANISTEQQLELFHKSITKYYKQKIKQPQNWFEAFECLQHVIQKSKQKKKVVFLDEMPWLHTPKSNFLAALEHFWNHWASQRKDLLFIVCGSATSWIVNKLFNNKAGLHNRITHKIHLKPFNLNETQAFFKAKNINWNTYQIAKAYMVFGGVPYYLENIKKGKSIDQNIDDLLFNEDGILYNEYKNLYHSLFQHPENYIEVIKALSTKNKGLTRSEIIKLIKLKTGGTLSTVLSDLETSGFIRKYHTIGKMQRDVLYQLIDAYSLFYYNFLDKKKIEKNYWLLNIDNAKVKTWSGYAFEMLCLLHTTQIKQALGISGVHTETYSWVAKKTNKGAQIDLVIDRKDQIINVFEIKFCNEEFPITTKYFNELQHKVSAFKSETKTKKAVFLSMITTYGIKNNENAGMVQNNLLLDDLFKI